MDSLLGRLAGRAGRHRVKRSQVRAVLNVGGLAGLSVAAGMLHVIAGVAAVSVALLLIAYLIDD